MAAWVTVERQLVWARGGRCGCAGKASERSFRAGILVGCFRMTAGGKACRWGAIGACATLQGAVDGKRVLGGRSGTACRAPAVA